MGAFDPFSWGDFCVGPDAQDQAAAADRPALVLTDAVLPGQNNFYTRHTGYTRQVRYEQKISRVMVQWVVAASAQDVLPLFVDLSQSFEGPVRICLESSHDHPQASHRERCQPFVRRGIDIPIVHSYMEDFSDILLHDGCTGFAMYDPQTKTELQWMPQGMLAIYALDQSLTPVFQGVLSDYNIQRDPRMRFVIDGAHRRVTCPAYRESFDAFRAAVCIEDVQDRSSEMSKDHQEDDPYGFRNEDWKGQGWDL